MDITNWLKDEFLEDYTKDPIIVKIENLSRKFDIRLSILAIRKKEGK